MLNDDLWNRSGGGTMSKNLYVLSFSLFTATSIFLSFLVARFTLHMELGLAGALVVLALGIVGVLMNTMSDRPILSLTGLLLVVLPYGALLGPFINQIVGPAAKSYLGFPITADIAQAFLISTAYVIVFGVIGTVIPDSLEKWWGWLIAGLTVGLLGYFVIPIAGFFDINIEHALGVWDWLIVGLFAFIIMFDFNRAMRIPYTLDNSIDVALAIYLDWFNVFVRIALALSRRNDD